MHICSCKSYWHIIFDCLALCAQDARLGWEKTSASLNTYLVATKENTLLVWSPNKVKMGWWWLMA